MYGIGSKMAPQLCVINEGGKPFDQSLFSNSYQNEEQGGKKDFIKLWLHAYCYTLPAGYGFEDQNGTIDGQFKVKTELPKWARTDYVF